MLEYRVGSAYDAIFPLGGGCPISFQLAHRGKRLFATPLDWTLIPDHKGIEYLPTGILSDFADMLKQKNLEVCSAVRIEKKQKTWSYVDRQTGFQFVHHFHGDATDPVVYSGVFSTHMRRLRRMLKYVEASKRVLFVLNTKFEFATESVVKIYNALVKRFPTTEVHLLVMMFGASTNTRETICKGLVVEHFVRPINDVYDMTMTSSEWEFLDWIQIRGRVSPNQQRRQSFLLRMVYKIWKTLGKWLARRNAGCLSIAFRTFGTNP